jgi:hypothetical protein
VDRSVADDGFVMASAADYGSTFGIVVFVQELALLAYSLARYGRDDDAAGVGAACGTNKL